MTKGRTLVMLPASTPNDQLEQLLQDTVHLFAEWFPGVPVNVPCDECQEAAREAANRDIGTIGQIGVAYVRLPEAERPAWNDYPAFKRWQQVALASLGALNPECDQCHGKGYFETETNPSTYFEYWDIGEDHEFFPEGDIPEVSAFEVLITLDGTWHHRWSQKDPSIENWERFVLSLIKAHPGHITGLCHMSY